MKHNTGVIIRKPKKTDYVAGFETGITYQEVLANGDWSSFLPGDEPQSYQFDTMACVSFSCLNDIESQVNFLLSKISAENLAKLKEWGYVKDNLANFSDRFTAKISGTTHQGNDIGSVIQSVRDYGLVPEAMWSFPANFTWDNYYAEIPQEVKDFGKHFLEVFDVKYEWAILDGWAIPSPTLNETVRMSLKQAPLQVAMPVCPGWGTDNPVKTCPSIQSQHATLFYNIDNTAYYDFDHYPIFRKRLSLSYPVCYGMRIVVSEKKAPIEPEPFLHCFSVDISFGQRNNEVKYLQDALKLFDCFPLNVLSTGYYGTITQEAVKKFQYKYKVASLIELAIVNGKRVGKKTRLALNNSLKVAGYYQIT
jgi:hypothetical protein